MADGDLFDAVVGHARSDMQSDPNMWMDRPEQPSQLAGQFDAMFREAVKDIRQTFNEVFFDHHEHAPEMGAPGNPTSQMVTKDLGEGYDAMLNMYGSQGRSQQQDMGMERE